MPLNELFPLDPLTEEQNPMSLAPVAFKKGLISGQPQGWEWAIPGAVRGLINDVGIAATAPYNALMGNLSENEIREAASRGASGLAGMGGAMKAPVGSMGVFAGRRAANADISGLSKAMTKESLQYSPEDILSQTGWFKDVDGKWKFEIPDEGAKWKIQPDEKYGFVSFPYSEDTKLSDVLDHPKLFEAYPQLKETKVGPTPLFSSMHGLRGYYDPEANKIGLTVGKPSDVLSTALHETQHSIQELEDFARGGNVEQFLPGGFSEYAKPIEAEWDSVYKELSAAGVNPFTIKDAIRNKDPKSWLRKYHDDALAKLDPGLLERAKGVVEALEPVEQIKSEAADRYRRLAGEVEARNVQERFEQGYAAPPWKTQGYIPKENQIISFHPGVPGWSLMPQFTPVKHDPFSEEYKALVRERKAGKK